VGVYIIPPSLYLECASLAWKYMGNVQWIRVEDLYTYMVTNGGIYALFTLPKQLGTTKILIPARKMTYLD